MYGHPMTPPKPRWKSKTYWVNGAILALAGAETQLHFLQPALPMNVFSVFAFALPVINLVLREFTSTPVGRIKNPPPFTPPFLVTPHEGSEPGA